MDRVVTWVGRMHWPLIWASLVSSVGFSIANLYTGFASESLLNALISILGGPAIFGLAYGLNYPAARFLLYMAPKRSLQFALGLLGQNFVLPLLAIFLMALGATLDANDAVTLLGLGPYLIGTAAGITGAVRFYW